MDFWTLLIAPALATGIGGILIVFYQQISTCLGETVIYMREVNENLVELRKDWDVLMGKRNKVSSKVDAGKQKGEQPLDEVSEWLSEVGTIETDIRRLLSDSSDEDTADQGVYSNDAAPGHQRRPTCGCCCSRDCFSNCCLGGEVAKILNEVRRLSSRGTFEVVTKADPGTIPIRQSEPVPIRHSEADQTGQPNIDSQGCVTFSAELLHITDSHNALYWNFVSISESFNEAPITVAKMTDCYYLEVREEWDTRKLTFGTRYEVVYVVKVEDTMSRWNDPATVRLMVPDKGLQERKFQFVDLIKNEWIEIQAGEFVAEGHKKPIAFYLYQRGSHEKKTGLQVKSVIIRPMQ